jgi:hypothetical protein
MKVKNGDMIADTHSTYNRLNKYLSQLLNVHNLSDFRQIEVHTAEPLIPCPICLQAEIAIAGLKK